MSMTLIGLPSGIGHTPQTKLSGTPVRCITAQEVPFDVQEQLNETIGYEPNEQTDVLCVWWNHIPSNYPHSDPPRVNKCQIPYWRVSVALRHRHYVIDDTVSRGTVCSGPQAMFLDQSYMCELRESMCFYLNTCSYRYSHDLPSAAGFCCKYLTINISIYIEI